MTKRLISPTQFIDRFVRKTETGQPLVLTPEQREILDLAFMLMAFWDTFIFSTIKKSGKTLINALIELWWAFTHPNDEILCLANDQEQSIGRVHKVAAGLIKQNPLLSAEAQVLSATIRFSNGTISNALTNEATTAAGANQGLSSWDELWGFQSERGLRLWEELTPLPNKPSVRMVTTYAGWEGESQLLWDLYLKGVGKDEHKDGEAERVHRSLPVYINKMAKILCYWDHEPRLPWQTQAYYDSQKRTLRPNTYARLHENRWTSPESTFITAEQWDACVDETRSPILANSARILGVDIGVKSDNAAVVEVSPITGGKIIILNHRVWRPTKNVPVNLAEVQEYIEQVARTNMLLKLLADPYQAMQMIQALHRKLGDIVVQEYPQTITNTTVMGETLFDLVKNRTLVSYPSAELKQHATNAIGIETERGVRMVKKKSAWKIDLAVALSMACVGAVSIGPHVTLSTVVAMNDGAPERTVDASHEWLDMTPGSRAGWHL